MWRWRSPVSGPGPGGAADPTAPYLRADPTGGIQLRAPIGARKRFKAALRGKAAGPPAGIFGKTKEGWVACQRGQRGRLFEERACAGLFAGGFQVVFRGGRRGGRIPSPDPRALIRQVLRQITLKHFGQLLRIGARAAPVRLRRDQILHRKGDLDRGLGHHHRIAALKPVGTALPSVA